MFKKFLTSIVIVTFVFVSSGILIPFTAIAAGTVTTATDVMSRVKASTASDHTITFVTPTGLASGQTITLTFSAGFTGVATMTSEDFDLAENSGSVCTAGTWTEKAVKTTPSTSEFSAIGSGQVVTILSGGASATLTAGRCIRIKAGLNATDTTGAGPGNTQISNGAGAGTDTITIAGTFTDTGLITVDIVDDDQVSVTANVNQTLTFDLDTAATDQETSTPYTVPLGVLSAGSVTRSGTASINMIIAEGLTNASGGMNITVRNANGVNGLVSTSVPADDIPSTTGTMAAGTPNYGLCVATANLTGFTRATGYVSDTCALASGTNQIRALSTTATNILTSSAPVAAGHAEIVVNAAISGATPAHTDYTDTLTFIASASF
jgi:hypothetical protein